MNSGRDMKPLLSMDDDIYGRTKGKRVRIVCVCIFSNTNHSETFSIVQDPLVHRITEKQRRDKMNTCLSDLSQLIPTALLNRKSGGRIEKIDIVLMAIEYINELVKAAEASYGHGFYAGMSEALRFIRSEEFNGQSDKDAKKCSLNVQEERLALHLSQIFAGSKFVSQTQPPHAAHQGHSSRFAQVLAWPQSDIPNELQVPRVSSVKMEKVPRQSDSNLIVVEENEEEDEPNLDNNVDDDTIRHFQWKRICKDVNHTAESDRLLSLPRKASSSSTLDVLTISEKDTHSADPSPPSNSENGSSVAFASGGYKKKIKDRFMNETCSSPREQPSPSMSDDSATSAVYFTPLSPPRSNECNTPGGILKRKLEVEDSSDQNASHVAFPGFILHPDRKFYMPAHFDRQLAMKHASKYTRNGQTTCEVLHPISISVAFESR